MLGKAGLNRRVPKPRPTPITEAQLTGWSMVASFGKLLNEHASHIAPNKWERHGLRELDRQTYFGLFLFGLFNPVVDSMRALCSATRLGRVQEALGRQGPVNISGFSDAQHVFDPGILEPVMQGLLAESLARCLPATKIGRITPELLRVFDSTLWKVVPRMGWANWRHQHCEQKAVRLHVKLRLADLQPDEVILTEGKICERAAMRKMLKPGEFYLGDRNYGADHALFPELVEMGCGFVLRMRDGTVWEVIENHPISPAAAAEGVTLDAMVRIGHKGRGGVQRVVVMKRPGMAEPLVLVTSEAPDSLERPGSARALPPPLGGGDLFPLAQMPGALPPLVCGKPRGSEDPDLSVSHQGAAARRPARQQAQQAHDGTAPLAPTRLGQRRGTGPPAGRRGSGQATAGRQEKQSLRQSRGQCD